MNKFIKIIAFIVIILLMLVIGIRWFFPFLFEGISPQKINDVEQTEELVSAFDIYKRAIASHNVYRQKNNSYACSFAELGINIAGGQVSSCKDWCGVKDNGSWLNGDLLAQCQKWCPNINASDEKPVYDCLDNGECYEVRKVAKGPLPECVQCINTDSFYYCIAGAQLKFFPRRGFPVLNYSSGNTSITCYRDMDDTCEKIGGVFSDWNLFTIPLN